VQAGGEDLTALGAAGVLDHVVIYEPLPPAPDYKRSVQFSIYKLCRDNVNLRWYWYLISKVPVRYRYCTLCGDESFFSLLRF
jgi:hypothetical protein